jgi:phage gp16-like protein
LIDESKFTKKDIKILKNKIAVYKVSIDNNNKITAINPIIKVGYKDKKIEKIIKEHFSIDNSLINYQTNTYLIYIDFSIYFI